MTAGHAPSNVTLRPVRESDADMLLAWRNDPFVVARTTTREPIALDRHMAWFRDTLAAPQKRLIWIVERASQPIGSVRFDRKAEAAVISIHLIESETGRGHGVAAIRMGCAEIFHRWPIGHVIACVREDNPPSQRAFLRAGFAEADTSACPAEHRTYRLGR